MTSALLRVLHTAPRVGPLLASVTPPTCSFTLAPPVSLLFPHHILLSGLTSMPLPLQCLPLGVPFSSFSRAGFLARLQMFLLPRGHPGTP